MSTSPPQQEFCHVGTEDTPLLHRMLVTCSTLKWSRSCRRSNSPEQGEPSEKEVRFLSPDVFPVKNVCPSWGGGGGCCRLNRVPEKEWARYPGPSSVFVLRHCRSELRGIYQILQGCFFSPSLWNHNLHGCEISVAVYHWESYLEKRVTEKNVAKENRDKEMSKYVVYESKYQFPKLVSFTHMHIYTVVWNIYVYHIGMCVCARKCRHMCVGARG